ncbi:hypothetical protein [Paraburkholderia bannensis]|uniref:hypothetical protein n=1 Tax=Paraburkholderia bannensis TaxID=765414 RepID=UPI002AC31299|nr:hypothetical protein [Paraburkholderia bannensis]
MIRRTKEKLRVAIEPREGAASAAPLYQNSLYGIDIDLAKLPIPQHWPRRRPGATVSRHTGMSSSS